MVLWSSDKNQKALVQGCTTWTKPNGYGACPFHFTDVSRACRKRDQRSLRLTMCAVINGHVRSDMRSLCQRVVRRRVTIEPMLLPVNLITNLSRQKLFRGLHPDGFWGKLRRLNYIDISPGFGWVTTIPVGVREYINLSIEVQDSMDTQFGQQIWHWRSERLLTIWLIHRYSEFSTHPYKWKSARWY